MMDERGTKLWLGVVGSIAGILLSAGCTLTSE